jgi:putative transposase
MPYLSMPRKARIDAPGALHHIIVRGIDGNPIFKSSEDYENFLVRLGRVLQETSTTCYAWALIPNHIHLLFRTGTTPISTVMRRLLTGYAQYYNRRHNRHGYLFQNRYKSFLCETDPYLLELVRYIHLNPIRANILHDMKTLHTYPYTGHASLIGKIPHVWQDTDSILSFFGQKLSSARRAYRSFMEKGISLGKRPDLTGGGLIRSTGGWAAVHEIKNQGLRVASDERILGSSDFVTTILKQAQEDYIKRKDTQRLTLADLIAFVARHRGADEALIKSTVKERTPSQARAIIAHLAIDRLRIPGVEVARSLNISPSAVSKLAGRGRHDPQSAEIEVALHASGKK